MEEERICTYCGEVLAEGEGTVVDEELLCDNCGETIWTEECVTDQTATCGLHIHVNRDAFGENQA